MTTPTNGELLHTGADTQVIVDTAYAAAEPKSLSTEDFYGIVVPAGAHAEVIDLEKHREHPRRARGTHKVATVPSFIDVVNRHEDENATTIWVHPTSGLIQAVLNDHGRGQSPEWGDHRAELRLIHTEAWVRWTRLDGQLLDQEAFAEHLQDGLTEIAVPDAATLLEIAQTMQATANVAWKAGVSLHDGSVQMGYTEEVETRGGRDGTLEVPTEFVLVLPPFVGEPPVQITARLRWRPRDGKLKLGYRLVNPQQVLQDVLEQIASRLRSEFPERVFLGEPRAAA
jgi:uncharacterized protein YfdQ (DUF2303 family)